MAIHVIVRNVPALVYCGEAFQITVCVTTNPTSDVLICARLAGSPPCRIEGELAGPGPGRGYCSTVHCQRNVELCVPFPLIIGCDGSSPDTHAVQLEITATNTAGESATTSVIVHVQC
jgi:hypothetical protein